MTYTFLSKYTPDLSTRLCLMSCRRRAISRKAPYSRKIRGTIHHAYLTDTGHRITDVVEQSRTSALRYLGTSGYRAPALLTISRGVDKAGRDVRYHLANDRVAAHQRNGWIANVYAHVCTINSTIHSRLHLGSTDRLPLCTSRHV